MPNKGEYPPPKIDELLRQKVSPDAVKPSYDQMAEWTRQLGRMIMKDCLPKRPTEVYDVALVVPRGGYFVNDVLTHAFGFKGRRLQALGVDSYEEDGITPRNDLEFTQIPDSSYINGRHVLLAEDVCDTGRTFEEGVNLLMGSSELVETNTLKASKVTTASVVYKPNESTTGFKPDYFVVEDDRWFVFPGEVYEQLGPVSLEERLWLPGNS